MSTLSLPPDVEAVFRHFFTCEITTINKQGQPLTWPNLPYYDEPNGQLIVNSSIAFPVKTYNARRNPKVALLYSDPTGSGLPDPPAVLVQGDATVRELDKKDDPPASRRHVLDGHPPPAFRPPVRRQSAGPPAFPLLFPAYRRVCRSRAASWSGPTATISQTPTEVEVRYVE